MPSTIAETDKKPGVFYAYTDDGIELPVIDIGHDAFALNVGTAELTALGEALRIEMREAAKIPPDAAWAAAEQSIIMRGIVEAAARGVLGGITSYLLRLGAANLGRGYAAPIDQKLVSGFNAVTMRLRLQETARSIASGLSPILGKDTKRPVQMVNIGGGTAIDSLNALMLVHREHPMELSSDRPVTIRVFDSDDAGPSFGSRAFAALSVAGAPLDGVNAVYESAVYDWNEATELGSHLSDIGTNEAIVAISSEGGLLEYGSDEAIRNNLTRLFEATPPDAFMIASVIRDDDLPREFLSGARLHVRIIAMDALSSLADATGWTLEPVVGDNPMYRLVRLHKA